MVANAKQCLQSRSEERGCGAVRPRRWLAGTLLILVLGGSVDVAKAQDSLPSGQASSAPNVSVFARLNDLDVPLGPGIAGDFSELTADATNLYTAVSFLGPDGISPDGDTLQVERLREVRLLRIPLAGGSPKVLASNGPGPGEQMVIRGGTIHWHSGDGIATLAVSGGSPSQKKLGFRFGDYAVDDNAYYMCAERGLVRVPIAGGEPTVLSARAASTETCDSVAVDSDHVYWVYSDDIDSQVETALMRVPKQGGSKEKLVTNSRLESFAIDGDRIYWSEKSTYDIDFFARTDGAIYALPKSGGDLVPIATEQTQPSWIGTDDTHIYWLAGGIWRMNKDGSDARQIDVWPEGQYHMPSEGERPVIHSTGLYWLTRTSGEPTIYMLRKAAP
jgi:hypothetical protein